MAATLGVAARLAGDVTIGLCLFGAAIDTGNLGVSALAFSTLQGLRARLPDASITLFDNGWGVRQQQLTLGGDSVTFTACGARLSHRWHRRESFANMGFSAMFGGVGNPGARALLRATAVLDVSGGDSFSDIYGTKRFKMAIAPKQLAVRRRRPLVLLPQTYGPFVDHRARDDARRVTAQAAMAWARDPDSFEALRDLLGGDFDPSRHRAGVDVAFGLPARRPSNLPRPIERWIEERDDHPIIGLNVSGLVYGRPAIARGLSLKVDYDRLCTLLVSRLLDDDRRARVLLIPHVGGVDGESDEDACAAVAATVPIDRRDRVAVLPRPSRPDEAKWVVGQCAWFCGMRMHSTIAALSSGVPASAIAYSIKTRGVFASCGLADAVIDARAVDLDSAVDRLISAWRGRASAAEIVRGRLPEVRGLASKQLDEIVEVVLASSLVGEA